MAIVDQHYDKLLEALRAIIGRTDLKAAEKMVAMTTFEFQFNRKQDPLFLQLHGEAHAGLHQRVILNAIRRIKPLLASVIESGVQAGEFNTGYPMEAAEFLLIGIKFLFDPGFFERSREDYMRLGVVVQEFIERMLGAVQGSLAISFNPEWLESVSK